MRAGACAPVRMRCALRDARTARGSSCTRPCSERVTAASGKAATATTSYTTVLAIDAPAAADADAAQVQQRIGAATSLSFGLQNERDLAVAMPVVLQFNASAAVAAPLPPSPQARTACTPGGKCTITSASNFCNRVVTTSFLGIQHSKPSQVCCVALWRFCEAAFPRSEVSASDAHRALDGGAGGCAEYSLTAAPPLRRLRVRPRARGCA